MSHREGEGLNCRTESLCGNTLRLELSNLTMYIYTVDVKVDFSILGETLLDSIFRIEICLREIKASDRIQAEKTHPRSVSYGGPSK